VGERTREGNDLLRDSSNPTSFCAAMLFCYLMEEGIDLSKVDMVAMEKSQATLVSAR
jgi:F0F1-type ATP synthase beta subunit